MIYLLTAIGWSPGGSSTVHICTQTIHRTIQNKQNTEQHTYLHGSPKRVEKSSRITLITETARCSETPVPIYQDARRHIPEKIKISSTPL